MNAQTLIDSTPVNNFNFGVFWKKTMESQSLKGDKSVARQEIKHPQSGFLTSFHHHSLMPQTLNYTKLNNARRNLEWQQAEKELGLIQL
jgi:hypothetical protein